MAEFFKNGKVANVKVIGKDPDGLKWDKASRVREYINYHMLEKMPNWLDQSDKLHSQVAVVGTSFTKTWYDPIHEMVRSELMPYDAVIVHAGIKNLEDCHRISEYKELSENELIEYVRADLFLELEFCALTKNKEDTDAVNHLLVEQHRYLDLDKDGYEEPYIVTVHHSSGKVLRITPRFNVEDIMYINDDPTKAIRRIIPIQYYTDYHFLPNPDGRCFFSLGFGTLLLDSNESVNTILNQLINAGHLATTQGGFIGKNLRIRKEDLYVDPGEWIVAEGAGGMSIKDEIVPFNYKEPSTVLFQLLGMLIEAAQSLTSTTDALTGNAQVDNVSPQALMALIQQGLKVFSATQRRMARGKKKELKMVFSLLSRYLNPAEYEAVIDPTQEEIQQMYREGQLLDFDNTAFDVVPMVDINMSTEAEMLAREQAAMQGNQMYAQMGAINPRVAAKNFYTALEVPNIDKLIAPEPDPNQPNPQLIEMQSQLDMRAKQLELKQLELEIKQAESQAKIQKLRADSLKAIADAEAAEAGQQLEAYKQAFDRLTKSTELSLENKKLDLEDKKATALPQTNIEE